jgi:GNAT superfamily N-acetyltransferase
MSASADDWRMTQFADLELARKLERAEGENTRSFVETRARIAPARGATWTEVGGTLAMFDGVGSPVTQTFGLGLFSEVTSGDLETLEEFFTSRGAEIHHEVSPLAGFPLFATLANRGYRPIELTSVMFRPLADITLDAAINPRIRVRRVESDEAGLFISVAARGWSDTPEVVPFLLDLSEVFAARPGGTSFVAELDGAAIAAGALGLANGVALLAGASTVPEGRRQGAQLALLEARLRFARDAGCELAMMGAAPGSGSQRNAERHGFRIAYTRVKWGRRGAAPPP